MKLFLLTGALCGGALPLLAQPRLAQRTDITAATPVLVPILEAGRLACQQYLPEVAANPAAVWTANDYGGILDFAVATQLMRTDPRWTDSLPSNVDTIRCTLTAAFEHTGRLTYFERELAFDTLPRPVRRAVRWNTERGGEVVLTVGSYAPGNYRRRRVSYKIWLYNPRFFYVPEWSDFRRNGRLIDHPGLFR